MRFTADSKGRLGSRELFPPEVCFEAEKDAKTAKVILIELVPKKEKPPVVKLVRRGGLTFLRSDRPLTRNDLARAMEEFP